MPPQLYGDDHELLVKEDEEEGASLQDRGFDLVFGHDASGGVGFLSQMFISWASRLGTLIFIFGLKMTYNFPLISLRETRFAFKTLRKSPPKPMLAPMHARTL